MSLLVNLQGSGPIYGRIYDSVRRSILSGTLRPGARLPSSRELAVELGVSRTAVLLAFDHLLAEGYTEGRRGSGTYVSADLPDPVNTPARRSSRKIASVAPPDLSTYGQRLGESDIVAYSEPVGRVPRYDFRYGRPALLDFPHEAWRRTLARCLRSASMRSYGYAPPAGLPELREQIASHARRARAVNAEASQVIIVNGSQQALDLAARLILDAKDRVILEDPHYQGARQIFLAAGAEITAIPVDNDGLDAAQIPAGRARAVYVTPSHQFPSGGIMSLQRRLALLEWARNARAFVLEDDYDGEFRYEVSPVESLQGLDTDGRVLYIGTFSKTFFPALRLGYLILPKPLVAVFQKAKWLTDRHTHTLEQEALAEFLRSGAFERHLRRARQRNAARRRALIERVCNFLGDRVEVAGANAGVHITLWLRQPRPAEEVVQAALEVGVGIYSIGPYYQKAPERTGFLLGYTSLSEEEIAAGIRLLARVL